MANAAATQYMASELRGLSSRFIQRDLNCEDIKMSVGTSIASGAASFLKFILPGQVVKSLVERQGQSKSIGTQAPTTQVESPLKPAVMAPEAALEKPKFGPEELKALKTDLDNYKREPMRVPSRLLEKFMDPSPYADDQECSALVDAIGAVIGRQDLGLMEKIDILSGRDKCNAPPTDGSLFEHAVKKGDTNIAEAYLSAVLDSKLDRKSKASVLESGMRALAMNADIGSDNALLETYLNRVLDCDLAPEYKAGLLALKSRENATAPEISLFQQMLESRNYSAAEKFLDMVAKSKLPGDAKLGLLSRDVSWQRSGLDSPGRKDFAKKWIDAVLSSSDLSGQQKFEALIAGRTGNVFRLLDPDSLSFVRSLVDRSKLDKGLKDALMSEVEGWRRALVTNAQLHPRASLLQQPLQGVVALTSETKALDLSREQPQPLKSILKSKTRDSESGDKASNELENTATGNSSKSAKRVQVDDASSLKKDRANSPVLQTEGGVLVHESITPLPLGGSHEPPSLGRTRSF